MLQLLVLAAFMGASDARDCEDCRGVMTPFCHSSCYCDKCDGVLGEYSCTGCWGRITPWCGRWCSCDTCDTIDAGLGGLDALSMVAETKSPQEAWPYLLGGMAACGLFVGVFLKRLVHSTGSLHQSLLSRTMTEDAGAEDAGQGTAVLPAA
mmetsp:Transcript_53971/g.101226  ORF Transcript_53971/g.101226 Transcript_53971/m.101226 type:complete len:151 (-) Transcript_53971:186-638(-)